MGKRLIIKGADFSQVAIPSSQITWLNTYEEPEHTVMCISGSINNAFGLTFTSGTKVSVLKCKILTNATGGPDINQMTVGSKYEIQVVTYSDSSYVSRTKVGEFELTVEDFQNGYKIVSFTEVTLAENQFIAIACPSDANFIIYIPISRTNSSGVTIHYVNSTGENVLIETGCKGIAFGYISEE